MKNDLQKLSPNIPSKILIIPIKEESSLGCCPLTAMMKRLTWSQWSRSLNTSSLIMLASVSLEGSSKPIVSMTLKTKHIFECIRFLGFSRLLICT